MKVILDACSAINLTNAQALEIVARLQRYEFAIGPQAFSECGGDATEILKVVIANGRLRILEDNDISSSLFLELLERFGLGGGETETITFASLFACSICTDDKKARQAGTTVLGANKVIGSIGLLKRAVDQELLTSEEAFKPYMKMKVSGGFLPDIEPDYFNASKGFA